MPVRFLDDPDGVAYRAAYFDDIPGVWRHGDFISETISGGLVFRGRSDATLKPGGVRVATADLYAALGSIAAIEQALAVGYTPASDGVERIVLFVVLAEGVALSAAVEEEIRSTLKRSNAFYVPALILAAPDLPRTANNKLAELPIKRILAGESGPAGHALANPQALSFFRTIAAPEVRRRLG
jgi:acetoacetyl-CoA synthetase